MNSTGTGLPDWRILQLVNELGKITERLTTIDDSEEHRSLKERKSEIMAILQCNG